MKDNVLGFFSWRQTGKWRKGGDMQKRAASWKDLLNGSHSLSRELLRQKINEIILK